MDDKKKDRIEGKKIVLYDSNSNTNKSYILKEVEIVTVSGKKRYKIRRTKNGGYLFN